MGDLGMHTVPSAAAPRLEAEARVFAQLQKIYTERPDGKGGMAACDTWDNALLHCDVEIAGQRRADAHRDEAPRARRDEHLVYRSARHRGRRPLFHEGAEDALALRAAQGAGLGAHDVGHGESAFPVVTGGIFEAGFPDCFQQMWAAFVAEREGVLGDRFGCATPDEAVASHELFAAALRSHAERRAVEI